MRLHSEAASMVPVPTEGSAVASLVLPPAIATTIPTTEKCSVTALEVSSVVDIPTLLRLSLSLFHDPTTVSGPKRVGER